MRRDMVANRTGALGRAQRRERRAITTALATIEALREAGHIFLRAVNFRDAQPDRLTVAEYEFRAALNPGEDGT